MYQKIKKKRDYLNDSFNKYYNKFNILSISLVIISLLLLIFKGFKFWNRF